MKLRLTALSAIAFTLTPFAPVAHAQNDKKPDKTKPAPVIIKFQAHAMHANDFQVRRNKDRSLATEINKKGLDVAFTEWMQRDHPFIFAKECVKQVGAMATTFKTTEHMIDFDKLMEKRSDLRLQAEQYGHDVAFAEWLRKECPDTYRQHFGLDKNNNPMKKHVKMDK